MPGNAINTLCCVIEPMQHPCEDSFTIPECRLTNRLTHRTMITGPRTTPHREGRLKLPTEAGEEAPFTLNKGSGQCPESNWGLGGAGPTLWVVSKMEERESGEADEETHADGEVSIKA